jgi:hypothetical protein
MISDVDTPLNEDLCRQLRHNIENSTRSSEDIFGLKRRGGIVLEGGTVVVSVVWNKKKRNGSGTIRRPWVHELHPTNKTTWATIVVYRRIFLRFRRKEENTPRCPHRIQLVGPKQKCCTTTFVLTSIRTFPTGSIAIGSYYHLLYHIILYSLLVEIGRLPVGISAP